MSEIGTASRPSHVLTFVHPPLHQKVGCPFGDRGSDPQSGTMALGVIDQPVTLVGQVTVNRMQGGPQLSRCRDGLSRTRLIPEMMHDRVDAIDADPGIGGFAVPQPPVQVLKLPDDHCLRRPPRRIVARQSAGDLLQVLKSHADVKPAKKWQVGDRRPRECGEVRNSHR